jgi:predicted O-methyltransferase YrrM
MNKNNYKFRTRVKHRYYRIKKNLLNQRLNLLTYSRYVKLKNSEAKGYGNLNDFYKLNKIKIIEGNSTQSAMQKEYLDKYKEHFKNVLEIGFNAGHSSEIFLSMNENCRLTSVDIGFWYYGKFGVEFLNKKYPGRLKVFFKDSVKALENYEVVPENTIFNFIYIDGNHSYEYAYNDIKNCSKFADKNTIVAIDDVVIDEKYRSLANTGPTEAWKNFLNDGFIKEIEVAHFKDLNRGIAVGKYNL